MKINKISLIVLSILVTLSLASVSHTVIGNNKTQEFFLNSSSTKVLIHGDTSYQFQLNNQETSKLLPIKKELKLRFASVDPLQSAPEQLLERSTQSSSLLRHDGQDNLYIVQLHTQALEALQQEISTTGATVLTTFPEHALIVRMNAAQRQSIEKLPFVRWVGVYHPLYKMESALTERAETTTNTNSNRYSIMVFNADMQNSLVQFIKHIGGSVKYQGNGKRLEASLNSAQLTQVSQRNEVVFIDSWSPPVSYGNIAQQASGAKHLQTVANYNGQGVRGQVMDDGIYVAHGDFQTRPPLLQGPYGSAAPERHGTNTYGSIFGDGSGNAQARGPLFAGQGIFSSYRNLEIFDRLTMARELVDPTKSYRAVFQSNSWGRGVIATRAYTTQAAELDDIAFQTDLLILNAMGNHGGFGKVEKLAFAKNIISVGGTYHFNTLSSADDKWKHSNIWPSGDFAIDGRVKPDLMHFFDNVLTTTNSAPNGYNTGFGGTSAATPLTAGHAGLVFQMWADGVFDGGPGKGRDVFASKPRISTVKALMINSATQYPFTGTQADFARHHQGWGMVNVKTLYEAAKNNNWQLPVLINESRVLSPLSIHRYQVQANGSSPIKATLVYLDPAGTPSSSQHRVNDITLKVIAPDGTVYWGNNGLVENMWSTPGGTPNTVDTVENVFIQTPQTGTWNIEIHGDEIVQDAHVETAAIDADYALVVTGGTASGGDITPPAVPTGLNATVNGSTSVNLNWADNTEADLSYYTVKRATLSGGPYTTLGTVTSSNYSDSNIAAGQSYFYVVSATDTSGNESANSPSVQATIPGALPQIRSFTLDATTINDQQTTIIRWDTVNANSVTASGSWSGNKTLSGSETVGPFAAGTYTFTISASNSNGTSNQSVQLTVTATGQAPTITSYSLDNTQISDTATTVIRWATSNADTVTATGAWSGTKAVSGNEIVGPFTAGNYTFTITASNAFGTTSQNLQLTVTTSQPAPEITAFTLDSAQINVGDTTIVRWTTLNADTVTATGAWSGTKTAAGNETIGPFAAGNYTLTLTASNSTGTISRDLQLTVSNATQCPAWAAWSVYSAGDCVSYQGIEYSCAIGHTALPGWEPPVVPALWQPK